MRKKPTKKKVKSKVQIYLESIRMIDAQIECKLIEKKQWEDIALGITANMEGERVQSSGSKSKISNAVERIVDIEDEINSLIDKLIDTKKEVTQTIEKLQSPIQYKVLHMKYIQYDKYPEFWDIADRFGRDYSWATTVHGRALKSLGRILKEREQSESGKET